MHPVTYARVLRFTATLIGVPLLGLLCANAGLLYGCGRSHGVQSDSQAAHPMQPAPLTPAPDAQPGPPVSQARPPEAPLPPAAAPEALQAAPAANPATGKFVAYYFHRTMRCKTCLAIEGNSKEAIEEGFAADLKSGSLAWRTVNIEEPANQHFESDFNLESSSLVLVEMNGDQVGRWQILESVWDLVDQPPALKQHVRTELAKFMAGGKAAS